MPDEYTDYILCRHIFRCTPEELERQDADTAALFVEFWNAEQKVQKRGKDADAEMRHQRGRGKRR